MPAAALRAQSAACVPVDWPLSKPARSRVAEAAADTCGNHCASAWGRASIAASRWKPAACSEASRVCASWYSSFRSLASASFAARTSEINASEYRNTVCLASRMRFMARPKQVACQSFDFISHCLYDIYFASGGVECPRTVSADDVGHRGLRLAPLATAATLANPARLASIHKDALPCNDDHPVKMNHPVKMSCRG